MIDWNILPVSKQPQGFVPWLSGTDDLWKKRKRLIGLKIKYPWLLATKKQSIFCFQRNKTFFNYTKYLRNNNIKTSVNARQTLSTFYFQVDDTYKIVEKIKKLKTNKYHAKYWLCNKDIYITKLSRPLTFIGIKTKDSCSRWTYPILSKFQD